MTVIELISLLEDMPEDAEVRIAQQPSYPLDASVRGVASSEWVDVVADDGLPVVYIAANEAYNYAPGWVYENAVVEL